MGRRGREEEEKEDEEEDRGERAVAIVEVCGIGWPFGAVILTEP